MNTKLDYMKFDNKTLRTCLEHKLSGNAMRLLIFYSLKYNNYRDETETKTDSEIESILKTSRITIL